MIDDSSVLVGKAETFHTLVIERSTGSCTLIQFEADGTYQKIFVAAKDRSKLAEIIKGE